MFHFIPAWYNTYRKWYDNTNVWYRGSFHMEFDDSINQLRMFQTSKQVSNVMILNYMPNLRQFLHRYGLLEVSYWSLFDAIQDVRTIEGTVLDFRDFSWPQGVEFIYTPFVVIAKVNGKKIAIIEFGENGTIIWIDYFKEDIIKYRYIFDDRGFISSILYFSEDGKEIYQDYLNTTGTKQFREFLIVDNRKVEIFPEAQYRFSKSSYSSMDDIVEEFARCYISEKTSSDDVFIISSSKNHNEFLLGDIKNNKVILSYFQNRLDTAHETIEDNDLDKAHLIIADSIRLVDMLSQRTSKNIQHLSPFDTRLALGKSQRIKELKIYFLLDGQKEERLEECLLEVFEVMRQDKNIFLNLVTYSANQEELQTKENFIITILEKQPEGFLKLKDDSPVEIYEAEGLLEAIEEPRVAFLRLHSENDIIQELEYSRIIVDCADEPNLYTQIAGISAGIPQINSVTTEFVEHFKNGYQLNSIPELKEALQYYLVGLANWNKSLVYTVQKIADYTSGSLVLKLIESLNEVQDGR